MLRWRYGRRRRCLGTPVHHGAGSGFAAWFRAGTAQKVKEELDSVRLPLWNFAGKTVTKLCVEFCVARESIRGSKTYHGSVVNDADETKQQYSLNLRAVIHIFSTRYGSEATFGH